MTGNNPVDRSKLGTKRHILTDRKGIPLSAVISSAKTHDIKLVTDVVDNVVIRRPSSKYRNKRRRRRRRRQQHLCLDKGYNSEHEEKELNKRGYVLHIPIKKKKKDKNNEKDITRPTPRIKKYSPKRCVVERTNSWHNRFRKTVYSL